jgi:hypothetical protein
MLLGMAFASSPAYLASWIIPNHFSGSHLIFPAFFLYRKTGTLAPLI